MAGFDSDFMRYRVSVQQPTETRGALGEILNTWEEVAEVWAGFWPGRGGESFVMRATSETKVREWAINFNPTLAIASKMRLVTRDGDIWNIRSFDVIGNKDFIRLTCEAVNG
jgi:head-tail adaptor